MKTNGARRMTQQRKVILEELRKVTSHPTAEELHQIVRKRLPRISIATVYRNLEVLADEGVVWKMDVAGTQRRFDGTTDNHYHIRCKVCGRLDDVHMPLIATMEESAESESGYSDLSHRVEFTGTCPACTKNN